MSWLVDTNAWIGFWDGDPKFGTEAKAIMVENPDDCFISVASLWEASIKLGLGKLKLPYDLRRDLPRLLDENGFSVLEIDLDDALGVVDLPPHHADPFDRLMVVQAMRRNLRVISRDPIFQTYGLRRVW